MYIPDKEDSMSKGTKARNNTVWLRSSALLEPKAVVVMSDESAGEAGSRSWPHSLDFILQAEVFEAGDDDTRDYLLALERMDLRVKITGGSRTSQEAFAQMSM